MKIMKNLSNRVRASITVLIVAATLCTAACSDSKSSTPPPALPTAVASTTTTEKVYVEQHDGIEVTQKYLVDTSDGLGSQEQERPVAKITDSNKLTVDSICETVVELQTFGADQPSNTAYSVGLRCGVMMADISEGYGSGCFDQMTELAHEVAELGADTDVAFANSITNFEAITLCGNMHVPTDADKVSLLTGKPVPDPTKGA